MTTIDIWQRQVLPRGDIGAGTARISPGEIIGNALQNFGQQAQSTMLDVARAERLGQERQERRDLQATSKLVLDFTAANDARMVELQQQAAPGGEGFVDAAQEDFNKRSAEFLKSVPDSARPYAEEQMARLWALTQGDALKYSATSRVMLDRKTAADIIDQGGAVLVTDPGKLDFVRENVVASIRALKRSPQEEAELLADVDSGLAGAALGGMVQKNARAALAQIDAGRWNSVGPDKLLAMRGAAESKIRQEEAIARMESNMRQAQAEGDLLGRLDLVMPALAETGVVPVDNKGVPLVSGPEEIMALIPGRRGEALARKFSAMQQEGQYRLEMSDTNIADDYARLQAMAPQPGQPYSAEQVQAYQSFGSAVQAKAKLLAEDPAAAVMGSPTLQQAWALRDSLASTPGVDPQQVTKATSAAVNATVQAQIDLGAAPWAAKPLTKAQAAGFAGSLRTARNPEAMKQQVEAIVALGPQAVGQVVAAGAPSGFAAMAAIDDPVLLDQFSRAIYRPVAEYDSILAAKQITRSDVAAAVSDELAPLYSTLPPDSVALYQDAFTDMAIDALGRGAANETIAAQSVTRTLMGGMQIDGHLRVPAGLDLGAVKSGLSLALTDLVDGKAGIEIQAPPGINGIDALKRAAVEGGLEWFTNETGDGAVLATPEGRWVQVITRTSRDKVTVGRYEVKFDDAMRRGL
ncbi:hypothetical protein [Dongia sp. agr-C8]